MKLMTTFLTNNTYPYKHWLTSLMAGPLILCIQDIVSGNNNLNDAVGFYILFVAFGFVYSLPVFLLYLLLFNLLIKKTASILIIKTVLNLTAIIGVFVTIKLIEGTMMTPTLALHYAIALIICSLIYKVKIQNTADT